MKFFSLWGRSHLLSYHKRGSVWMLGALLGLVSHHSPLPLTAEWPLVVTHKEVGFIANGSFGSFWGVSFPFYIFFPILFISLTPLLSSIFHHCLNNHYPFSSVADFAKMQSNFSQAISGIMRWLSKNKCHSLWIFVIASIFFFLFCQMFLTEINVFTLDAKLLKIF